MASNTIRVATPIVSQWTAFIPPTSAGLGTLTGVSLMWRRNGANLEIFGGVTIGTVTGVAAFIGFPTGFTLSNNLITYTQTCGTVAQASVNSLQYTILIANGNNGVFFSRVDLVPTQPQNGNSLFANNQVITFTASAPVNEFQE